MNSFPATHAAEDLAHERQTPLVDSDHDASFATFGNLGPSATSGVKWNFVSQVGQQVTQTLTTIILARLLAPHDFGLLGMAMVFIGFLSLFKDLGTSAAVIRNRCATRELLSTVFWANVFLGVLGSLVLIVVAPWAAAFYHQPGMSAILRVLAIGFIISGSSNLQKSLLERDLKFRVLARVELLSILCGAVVGIGSALYGAGVWALVTQALGTIAATSLLLWISSDYRPDLCFSWTEARSVSSFSLNLTGFNVFNYLVRNADYVLIGRYLGSTPLGIYTLAYRIMLYPMQSVTTVISRVMFPVYAQMQDNDARLRSAFIRTAAMIALVTFPFMIGICVLAEPFIQAVFGAKWEPAIPLIRILAPIGMIQSVFATVGSIYLAKDRTDVMFRWGVASGILTVSAFAVGLHWGILGVASAYAFISVTLLLPCLLIPFRLIGMRLGPVVLALLRPFVASLLMASGVALLGVAFHLPRPGYNLVLLVPAGVLFYSLASWALNRAQLRDALNLAVR